MFTKNQFIEVLTAIENQHNSDSKYTTALSNLLNAKEIPVYDHSSLINVLFKLLQEQFPPIDGDCEIERYCYELSFGWIDGVRVISYENLWDALILRSPLVFLSNNGHSDSFNEANLSVKGNGALEEVNAVKLSNDSFLGKDDNDSIETKHVILQGCCIDIVQGSVYQIKPKYLLRFEGKIDFSLNIGAELLITDTNIETSVVIASSLFQKRFFAIVGDEVALNTMIGSKKYIVLASKKDIVYNNSVSDFKEVIEYPTMPFNYFPKVYIFKYYQQEGIYIVIPNCEKLELEKGDEFLIKSEGFTCIAVYNGNYKDGENGEKEYGIDYHFSNSKKNTKKYLAILLKNIEKTDTNKA